jgi:hypothetical protein
MNFDDFGVEQIVLKIGELVIVSKQVASFKIRWKNLRFPASKAGTNSFHLFCE